MTGWAQVRCGYATDCASSAEKLSYDFWYMRHGNLAVDIAVCIRTRAPRSSRSSTRGRSWHAGAVGGRRRGCSEDGAALRRSGRRALAPRRRRAEAAIAACPRESAAGPRSSAPVRPRGARALPRAGGRGPGLELRASLRERAGAATAARAIVLAPGALRRPAAVPQPARPPPLRGATRPGGAARRAEPGRQRRAAAAGSCAASWSTSATRAAPSTEPRSRCGARAGARSILDTTRRGPRRLPRRGRGAAARRACVIRRVVVRGFTDFGVLVDANDPDRGRAARAVRGQRRRRRPRRPAATRLVDGPGRGLRLDRRHRRRCGACARARARWRGLWTGTADPARALRGDRRRPHAHRRLRRALHPRQHVPAPADRPATCGSGSPPSGPTPAWGGRPASVGNVIEDSRFESRARRRLPRRGDDADDRAAQHVRRPGVGGDRRLPRQRQRRTTATTTAGSRPARSPSGATTSASFREG